MYDRIKRMDETEMKNFIYWVYLMGNEDGYNQCEDSPSGYFGGYMLTLARETVMPNDSVSDLWDKLEDAKKFYKGTEEANNTICCLCSKELELLDSNNITYTIINDKVDDWYDIQINGDTAYADMVREILYMATL